MKRPHSNIPHRASTDGLPSNANVSVHSAHEWQIAHWNYLITCTVIWRSLNVWLRRNPAPLSAATARVKKNLLSYGCMHFDKHNLKFVDFFFTFLHIRSPKFSWFYYCCRVIYVIQKTDKFNSIQWYVLSIIATFMFSFHATDLFLSLFSSSLPSLYACRNVTKWNNTKMA